METIENELLVVSNPLVEDMHRKYGGSHDTQEGDRLIRVDLSCESSGTEDPLPPPSKDGEAYQQRLWPPLASAIVPP